jgi:tRNA pseudouridine55 synthase
VDGVLLVDKPPGVSSHHVVAATRRRLGRGVKVGHAGTLDPFATGLLLVLVGRATRVQRWLMGLPKEYETTARLGWTSTTGDPEGETVETGRVPPAGVVLPTGLIRQRPPAYSAIHIDGERAYARARRGEVVEVPEREVEVTAFTEEWRRGDEAHYRIACGSGTYVRTLIADLGDAYCLTLRRTAIGPFSVADADDERLLPLAEAVGRVLPTATVGEDDARLLAHGRRVDDPAPDEPGAVLVVDAEGPVAITEPDGDGRRRSIVGFRA